MSLALADVRIEIEPDQRGRHRVRLACRRPPDSLPCMQNLDDSGHARAAHAVQVEIYRAMTPVQRMEQALRMNRSMRELLAAGF